MILILSDLHLGKSDPVAERAKERDVVNVIRSYQDRLKGLYLLGDIFDHYVEYRLAIPKGFSRFLGTLADVADEGSEIVYFYGNHDPWHLNFFREEFNARIVEDSTTDRVGHQEVYFAHGDGRSKGLYKTLRPILRHRLPTMMYRYLLPGDTGISLARWSSRRFSARETNMETVESMREYAFNKLTGSADIVVMGHCHFAELSNTEDGIYMNTGSWHDDRTFGIIDNNISLMRWTGTEEASLNTIPLAQ